MRAWWGQSALGLRTERTCLEFLVASKGSPENIGQEPVRAELRPGVCGGAAIQKIYANIL